MQRAALRDHDARPGDPDDGTYRRADRWVPVAIFLIVWGLTTHGKFSVSGDEPHYLMVAESLRSDGDLDLIDEYAGRASRRFGREALEVEGHARPTAGGRLLPVHDIGLPVLLLPVYAAATTLSRIVPEPLLARFRMTPGLFAYSLVSLSLAALAAAAAGLLLPALRRAAARDRDAVVVVLAVWLSPPLLSSSFLVYPEVPALLVTALAVRLAHGPPPRRPALATAAAALALGSLPWLHRKFVLMSWGAAAVLWRRRGVGNPSEGSGSSEENKPPEGNGSPGVAGHGRGWDGAGGSAALAALFVLPQLGLAAWTLALWGSLGGPLMIDRLPLSAATLVTGGLGMLVDREYGLLAWSPFYLLLPACWWVSRRRTAIWLLPAALLLLPAAAHDQWWGGFSPAARFFVPLAPVFAVVLAAGSRSVRLRRALALLLVPQLFIDALAWQWPRLLWPRGTGDSGWLGLRWMQPLAEWLPSVYTGGAATPAAWIAIGVVAVATAVLLWGLPHQSSPEA